MGRNWLQLKNKKKIWFRSVSMIHICIHLKCSNLHPWWSLTTPRRNVHKDVPLIFVHRFINAQTKLTLFNLAQSDESWCVIIYIYIDIHVRVFTLYTYCICMLLHCIELYCIVMSCHFMYVRMYVIYVCMYVMQCHVM